MQVELTRLLGRGSVTINTGGEKVFPEEVEGVLKEHPDVRDVLVVGAPDTRFGEIVVAVVEASKGAAAEEAQLIDHVRKHLSKPKAPRRVMFVDSLGRAATGKADYPAIKQRVADWLRRDGSSANREGDRTGSEAMRDR